mgnify:CR=1 FL=1|tara:strand:+ start:264 stop:1037 length:774 start_codon:yes stop_codon:yes gene_type:complete
MIDFKKKIAFVSSDEIEAKKSMQILKKKYQNVIPEKADLIIALGGDGTILETLHKFLKRKIPIYGMNRGHVGFLMNQYSEVELLKRLNIAIPTKLFPLKIKSFNKKGEVNESLAFNDVSFIRNSRQIAKISIEINGVKKIDELLCDGCLISTPAGSSAYNLSLRGPVIPLGAKLLALTPISPYRPRTWRGALLPNTVKITLTALDEIKRPVRAEADFFEVKNINKIEVELDKNQYIELLFDQGHDLEERIINEQFIY